MSARPQLFTRGRSALSQSTSATDPNSAPATPVDQRDDAKRNLFKSMRPLPTQHRWVVYFDRPQHGQTQHGQTQQTTASKAADYQANLEQLGDVIESVQDFWRYNNNTPVDQMKMRESLYLFKQDYRPVWEDRRNINGGSWTFRVPKSVGPEVWTNIQLLAIGETLQSALEEGDQICGVGLSVRFNMDHISIWHRDASKQESIQGILDCVLQSLPPQLQQHPLKERDYTYKKHADNPGFNAPPELQAVVDSQRKRDAAAAAAAGMVSKATARAEKAAAAASSSSATTSPTSGEPSPSDTKMA